MKTIFFTALKLALVLTVAAFNPLAALAINSNDVDDDYDY
jgi:hypothetical protein